MLAVAGCSTSPADLEKKASTQTATRSFSANYQGVYRRLYSTAKRCADVPVGAATAMRVDGQLYSELGFGEITYAQTGLITNYYWKAKVERAGQGSKMTVSSGNTINNAMWLNQVSKWADGDEAC
ncbi:hypothetical protein AB4144_16225 [Rhizobiaceae sp. 2RAB30]